MVQRLLFVEDEKGQQTLFNDALNEWNQANAGKRFELEMAETYDAGLAALDRTRFDGALLDLRLTGSGGRTSGELLAARCVTYYGIPAAIISGHPGDYDRSSNSGMLAVFDKGDGDAYEKAMEWFGNLWHMMKVLGNTRANVQKLGAAVFYRQVWPRWQKYESLSGIDDSQLIGIVSRQYASHIADTLGIDSDENVKWHPFENYIQPALQEARPHTGDVFRLDGKLWIVLTPQCDMATQKVAIVLLANCEPSPAIEEWKEHLTGLQANASNNKKKAAERFFGKLVNQAEPAQHFLPPLEGGQPLMVDFKMLLTIPLAELQGRLSERVASVATPFLGNLTQRFGAYVSRMGQPNIDIGHLS